MPKKPSTRKQPAHQKRAIAYVVDTAPGEHSYRFVEGVGECRAHFMKLMEDLDKGVADVVVVAAAKLLYIDTSPMWMERFIATVKRRGVLIADAEQNKEYDLRQSEDEGAFRALRKQQ
jgi:hypothetical protein